MTLLLIFSVSLACGVLRAEENDTEAVRVYGEGHALYEAGDYYQAAKKFEDTERLAGTPAIKANSLVARIGAWKMCNMMRRELECIEKLLTRYPEYSDYKLLSERIYEIGDRYYAGEREPSYWHLRWIPWLNDGDKTIDIYRKALERAPFSESAPRARLRLAYLLDRDGKAKDAIAELRTLIKNHPASSEYKYALLALAESLFIAAEKGDGDGRLVQEAFETLKTYEAKFPGSSEMSWVRRRMLQYSDMQAKRLCDMADYYSKNNRTDASRRYYADVISKYPESSSAADAEQKLISLDPAYIPAGKAPAQQSRQAALRAYKIPEEASRVLISPATDTSTHYLRPVMDLQSPDVKIYRNKPENATK